MATKKELEQEIESLRAQLYQERQDHGRFIDADRRRFSEMLKEKQKIIDALRGQRKEGELMTVMQIIEDHLRAHGFDGLWNLAGDCGCKLDDLMPCGDGWSECEPGYLMACDCGEHDLHIGPAAQTTM